jgi:hypothetical protein
MRASNGTQHLPLYISILFPRKHLRKKGKSTNSIGIGNRRLQPRLVTMRSSSNDVFGKTNGPGFGKRAAGSPVALRKIEKWTLWRGRPPPKRKKEQEAEEEPVR